MHSFFGLREQLPWLAFDPATDAPVQTLSFLAGYNAFYALDFPASTTSFHATGRFKSGSEELVAQYWLPANPAPKGTVFVLHGYYDHVGLFHHIIRFLLEEDFAVVAFDLPGHGLSSGERASIGSFGEYVAALQTCLALSEKLPKPWHALGQSTGGAILLHMLMVEKITKVFHRVVLLAPLIRPTGWHTGVWLYRLLKPFTRQIKRHFSENSNDAAFVSFCRESDRLQPRYLSLRWVGAMKEWLELFPGLGVCGAPVLLIQGESDTTVDWRYNMELLEQKLAGAQIIRIPEARHQLVNEAESIRQQIFTRVQEFLLASGKH